MFKSCKYGISILALTCVFNSGANADNNTLTIGQTGSGNRIYIDQTKANGSRVSGINVEQTTETFQHTVQELYEEEVNGVTTTLTRDVIETFTPDLLTATIDENTPLSQSGIGNSAKVQVTGNGGVVGLYQGVISGGNTASGNIANIKALDGADALIAQGGSGNTADLTVRNGAKSGSILQNGNDNNANLDVSGVNSSGLISQIGDRNTTTLEVAGSDTNVSYIVNGSDLSSASGAPVSVTTNATTVLIQQTR